MATYPYADARQARTDPLLREAVEELWRKGYDLQQTESGWIVKEPLGGKSLQIASDAGLLGFAAGRVACLPAKPAEPPPMPARVANDPGPGMASETALATFPASTRPPWMARSFYAFVGLAGLAGLSFVQPPSATRQTASRVPDNVEQARESAHAAVSFRSGETRPIAREAQSDESEIDSPSPRPPRRLSVATLAGRNDLTSVSELCASQLRERFGVDGLSLMLTPRTQSMETCYTIQGKEHCPYVSNGQAVFCYVDNTAGQMKAYACDVDLGNGTVGNLRLTKANPDIVRFLLSDASSPR